MYNRRLSFKAWLSFCIFCVEMPRFVGPVVNVTVPLGREAVLSCSVENLATYKVSIIPII